MPDPKIAADFIEGYWRERAEQAEAALADLQESTAAIIWKGITDNGEWQKRAGTAWKMWAEERARRERLINQVLLELLEVADCAGTGALKRARALLETLMPDRQTRTLRRKPLRLNRACVLCGGCGEVCTCTGGQNNVVKDSYCRVVCGMGPRPCPWCWSEENPDA